MDTESMILKWKFKKIGILVLDMLLEEKVIGKEI